jgi:hypothetical protein
MSLDSLNKEEKDQLSKEVNMELKSIAELMGAQNMRLRRNMDRDFRGFRGDETIKDFEKHLKELGEESRTVTPEGNIGVAMLVGILSFFTVAFTMGSPLFFVSTILAVIPLLYAGIMHKRNEKITSKKDQITYIEKRIKELKEYGEK